MPSTRLKLITLRTTVIVFALLAVFASLPIGAAPENDEPTDPRAVKFFEDKVRPVLAESCFPCHSTKKQKGGLRLDSRAAILKGGESGPAIKPGKPDESLLVKAIKQTEHLKMPPAKKLPDAVINDLARWVTLGVPWPGGQVAIRPAPGPSRPIFTEADRSFWAFRKPIAAPGVVVKDRAWVRSPIDAFILAGLEAKGLRPAPTADRRTLIRRATFDLIGLPPTPADVESALNDRSADWFAKAVDRLLSSPHYGERWGRRWLDVARYADSNGMDENLTQANAWRYRDYVINAFNKDKPYDRFVREQLAGDLLPATDEATTFDQIIATGFLALGPKMLAEDDPVKMQMDIVDEQIDTVGRTFMGLTLGCARCHDHKFDPLPTADYYGLAGIFKSTQTMDTFSVVARWHERTIATKEELARREAHDRLLSQNKDEIDRRVRQANETLLQEARKRVAEYIEAAEVLRHAKSAPARKPIMADAKETPPGAMLIEAEKFARSTNILAVSDGYGQGIGVIITPAASLSFVEYDMTVPQAGIYQVELRYAAAESRPIKVIVDGQTVNPAAAAKNTGSWYPDMQTWEVAGVVALPAGKSVVRLERATVFPHIDKLVLLPRKDLATTPKTAEQVTAERKLIPSFLKQWAEHLAKSGKPANPEALQKVVADPKGPFALPVNIEAHYATEIVAELKRLRAERAALEKARPLLPEALAVNDGKVGDVRIHIRGSHWTQGAEVPRQFPRILTGDKPANIGRNESGRLQLADWLTQADHPLTARVMANRIWLGHFGEGLVRSPDNFGRLGERPVNQALLDWLAVRFVEEGWSIKAMHRLIMLSSTYQMSTTFDEKAAQVDPENRLHWRMNRRRLEAEAIRDAVLVVSGRLDHSLRGSLLQGNNRAYVLGYPNSSYDRYDYNRRSVYLPVIRSDVYQVFQAFDFADPSMPNGSRPTTTVAPQALFMMNGKLVLEQTKHLASVLLEQPIADAERVRQVYARALARLPSEPELSRILEYLRRIETIPELQKLEAKERQLRAWQSVCRVILASNEFIYVE